MKAFIISLLMISNVYAVESISGHYLGVFGDSLKFEIFPTSDASNKNKLFVYVPGDGDICEVEKNPYQTDLSNWNSINQFSSQTGDWLIAEKTIDKYCKRAQRLDGIDYYHRIEETSQLIRTVLEQNSHYNQIYIIGHSAGALLAPLIAIKLQDEYPIAGVMMASMMGRDFSDYMAETMAKWLESEGSDHQYIMQFYMATTQTFELIKKDCSPYKKSIAPLWGNGKVKHIRTDNFYCQQDDENYLEKLSKLNNDIPVMVLQGDQDSALQSSISESLYRANQLIEMNKTVSVSFIEGMGHGWSQHAQAFFVTIDQWAK